MEKRRTNKRPEELGEVRSKPMPHPKRFTGVPCWLSSRHDGGLLVGEEGLSFGHA
jgi:hypothetical protein